MVKGMRIIGVGRERIALSNREARIGLARKETS